MVVPACAQRTCAERRVRICHGGRGEQEKREEETEIGVEDTAVEVVCCDPAHFLSAAGGMFRKEDPKSMLALLQGTCRHPPSPPTRQTREPATSAGRTQTRTHTLTLVESLARRQARNAAACQRLCAVPVPAASHTSHPHCLLTLSRPAEELRTHQRELRRFVAGCCFRHRLPSLVWPLTTSCSGPHRHRRP